MHTQRGGHALARSLILGTSVRLPKKVKSASLRLCTLVSSASWAKLNLHPLAQGTPTRQGPRPVPGPSPPSSPYCATSCAPDVQPPRGAVGRHPRGQVCSPARPLRTSVPGGGAYRPGAGRTGQGRGVLLGAGRTGPGRGVLPGGGVYGQAAGLDSRPHNRTTLANPVRARPHLLSYKVGTRSRPHGPLGALSEMLRASVPSAVPPPRNPQFGPGTSKPRLSSSLGVTVTRLCTSQEARGSFQEPSR